MVGEFQHRGGSLGSSSDDQWIGLNWPGISLICLNPMTKLILLLLACTACASAPVTSVSAPVPAALVSGPILTGAAKWADSASRLIDKATFAGNLQGLRNAGLVLDQALTAYPNDALLLQYQGYELISGSRPARWRHRKREGRASAGRVDRASEAAGIPRGSATC